MLWFGLASFRLISKVNDQAGLIQISGRSHWEGPLQSSSMLHWRALFRLAVACTGKARFGLAIGCIGKAHFIRLHREGPLPISSRLHWKGLLQISCKFHWGHKVRVRFKVELNNIYTGKNLSNCSVGELLMIRQICQTFHLPNISTIQ